MLNRLVFLRIIRVVTARRGVRVSELLIVVAFVVRRIFALVRREEVQEVIPVLRQVVFLVWIARLPITAVITVFRDAPASELLIVAVFVVRQVFAQVRQERLRGLIPVQREVVRKDNQLK